MSKTWIQYGANAFDLGNQINSVSFDAMARSLSHLNRFCGHTVRPYSVAEHSLNVSQGCYWLGGPIAAMYGLLHDLHETVTCDVSTPVKEFMGDEWRQKLGSLQDQTDRCLYGILGVPYPVPLGYKALVKKADMTMLATERRDLMDDCQRDWDLPYEPYSRKLLQIGILPVDPKVVANKWKDTFRKLELIISETGGYPHE